ncbi:MAG: L-glutamate gamma-semialdehyde dehydrogenase [Bacteroidales bacterium]
MATGFFHVPLPKNEPVLNYAPGTPERVKLKKAISEMLSNEVEIPMFIGGKEVKTGKLKEIRAPHDHSHILGYYHEGDAKTLQMAIDAALSARRIWAAMPWEQRAAVFLKAADMLCEPYFWTKINAATMLGQSKNVFQSEIDAVCELTDFFRFNVKYMSEIYDFQPISPSGIWNRLDWRPLEGFIFALTPFNFTSIAGNLPSAPAMMGNVVIWKPSKGQILSARVIMELFKEAGLPDGVINQVFVSGPVAGETIFSHPNFAGFHFTGSTEVFQGIWKTIGNNIHTYKTYPRIVGETGGKDFVMVHNSAQANQVSTALVRGAFEYQGQKCSAASRAYIPQSLWPAIRDLMMEDLSTFKMGGPEDFSNFINAVIDEAAFNKLSGVIERIKKEKVAKIIAGGGYDKSKGYFIEPTIIETSDPKYFTMEEEFFGPILSVYVYPDNKYEEVLKLCDSTSIYALTGSIFATDREAINLASATLVNAAGNFYINDKPTGAVVGQQPFGGSRGSGTNDKAGSVLNLIRWLSPRTIKENFVPPTSYQYPFMDEK